MPRLCGLKYLQSIFHYGTKQGRIFFIPYNIFACYLNRKKSYFPIRENSFTPLFRPFHGPQSRIVLASEES